MTPETKRNVFRYGVAVDLVILATGLGLLLPAGPVFLTLAYLTAVGLSVWKGGWQGGTAANVAAVLALLALFGDVVSLSHVIAFAAIATVITAIVHSLLPLTAPLGATTDEVAVADGLGEETLRRAFVPSPVDDAATVFAVESAPIVEAAVEPRAGEDTRASMLRTPEPEEVERRVSSPGDVSLQPPVVDVIAIAAPEPGPEIQPETLDLQPAPAPEPLFVSEAVTAPAAEPPVVTPPIEEVAPVVVPIERRGKKRLTKKQKAAAEAEAAREAERLAAEEMLRVRLDAERAAAAEAEAALQRRLQEEREELQRQLEETREAERLAAEETLRVRLDAERAAAAEAEAALQRRLQEEREEMLRQLEEAREAERLAAEEMLRARLESERAAAAETEAALQRRLQEEREELQRQLDATREAERLAAEETLRIQLESERAAAAEAEAALQRRLLEEREQLQRQLEAALEKERLAAEEMLRIRLESERAAAAEAEAALQRRLQQERDDLHRQLEEAREAERRAAEEAVRLRFEEERAIAAEASLQKRLEEEREQLRRELQDAREAEKQAAEETLLARLAEERAAMQKSLEEQLTAARAEMDRDTQERIAAAQREAEQRTAEARAAEERAAEATRRAAEAARAAEERAAEASRVTETARVSEQRGIEAQQQREPLAHKPLERTVVPPPAPQKGLFSTISGWLQGGQPQRDVSVKAKKIIGSGVATRPAAPSSRTAAVPARRSGRSERKPRLLMLERRRGSADTVIPRLRQRGVEVQVVERWIDAVDEIFRFQPDAFTLDSELPDFAKIYKTLRDQRGSLPLFVTGRSMTTFTPPSDLRFVSFVGRPYDPEELANVARDAAESPAQLLARQAMPRSSAPLPLPVRPRTLSTPMPLPVTPTVVVPTDSDATPVDMGTMEVPAEPQQPAAVQDAMYDVACFNCRVTYDATDADWCSCLTKERTLVCTNCLTCFCKAPPSYKEKFWIDAPARLFEKKTAEARRHQAPLGPNPHPSEVKRPLVLTVEDDEDIRVIVQRVCSNLNYGFVHAENGQDGLAVAREYRPNLILSDAFMPKLDGREMCRILRDDLGADVKMVVMTGLYTDTKYRSEALKRFKVDDYLSKPVAITELVNLLQRHLEGVMNLPEQEDLHALHRQAIPAAEEENLALADVLDFPTEAHGLTLAEPEPDAAQPAPDAYEVCCHQCNAVFDAVKAEWCTCLGRDQTLACPECGSCFCKAAAAYKEKFWMDAPSSLFERKMIGSKRNVMLRTNPETADVKRPLILLVEDDENIQLIVRTVVTSMGFGFIVGANGQEGLALAREYLPDLILSDAFMPKLDGREMCRLLKSDPSTARIKAIIMTGLYTDRKYRSEALDYFKVDDYVAKPLAVDDLIKLFKKHLPQEVHQTM